MMTDYSELVFNAFHGSEKTIATAESCTGGAIAAKIVARSGASEYFKGGVISYCNEIKESVLGVQHDTLERETAVCESVAVQMAQGVCQVMAADYAVSITGCAGPGGGTTEIPVGTIWICAASKHGYVTKKLSEDYGRERNLSLAVNEALALLLAFFEQEINA